MPAHFSQPARRCGQPRLCPLPPSVPPVDLRARLEIGTSYAIATPLGTRVRMTWNLFPTIPSVLPPLLSPIPPPPPQRQEMLVRLERSLWAKDSALPFDSAHTIHVSRSLPFLDFRDQIETEVRYTQPGGSAHWGVIRVALS